MSKNFKNRNLVISDIFYFIPGRGAKYCDKRVSVSVCLSVFLLAYLKTAIRTSQNFLHVLTDVAVAWSSYDEKSTRCVLLATKCLPIGQKVAMPL